MSKQILIVAGGTGGHLYPGISLARVLSTRGWKPSFVVRNGDLGRAVLEREGFPVQELQGQGLPRSLSWKLFLFPIRLASGFRDAFELIKAKPPACVVGMGGYLSFPVLLAAVFQHVPTLIHEQNVVPGLANRILSRMVDTVAVSFEESMAHFPKHRTTITGLPVRSDTASYSQVDARRFFEIDPDALTFLVFGGSQGAQRLNAVVMDTWKKMAEAGKTFQVIHITGERNFSTMKNAYQALSIRARLLPYCHTMAGAYAAADVVVCRSGASTVAELVAARRVSVLVPFPYASADHQRFNAEILSRAGVARILPEANLSAGLLFSMLQDVVRSTETPDDLLECFDRLSVKIRTADAALRLAALVEMLAPL